MSENVVLLFDSYHADSQSLHRSFKLAGRFYPAVVIEDDGFLPEDVQSVFGYFLGDFAGADNSFGRPRYFNQVPIPDYWEISGNNLSAKVNDLYHERARIFYTTPTHQRLVRVVDWLDAKGVVRYSDHYNRYGAVFARTTFNGKGQKTTKSYFSAEGKEIIVENFVTGDIILNDGKAVRLFNNKVEFIAYFFQVSGYAEARIFFNSLAMPFFVSNRLPANGKQDVLFWQEPISNEIPGNMQMILKGQAPRAGRVYVQKRAAFDRLMALGADPQIVKRKGFIYPFARQNRYRPTALICTNSDQIEHCEQIVAALPDMQFHIAALTEMSSKLMAMGKYANVHLYPGVKPNIVEDLFEQCDFYLDINHANEILSAVQKAFLNNQAIFAFQNTVHDGNYIPQEHIYAPENAAGLIADIHALMESHPLLDVHLARQRQAAMAEDEMSFLNI